MNIDFNLPSTESICEALCTHPHTLSFFVARRTTLQGHQCTCARGPSLSTSVQFFFNYNKNISIQKQSKVEKFIEGNLEKCQFAAHIRSVSSQEPRKYYKRNYVSVVSAAVHMCSHKGEQLKPKTYNVQQTT